MKKIINRLLFLSCFSFAFHAHAGTNPIAWSLSPTTGFPANTAVGSTYAVTYTITNNLPFAVPLTVTDAYVGGTFTLTNGCNKTLAAKDQAGSSCLVHLSFQPVRAGVHDVQLTLAYHKNRVPLPKLTSTASSNETNDKISGRVTIPLPPVTYTGINYPVEFSFVNNGERSVTATAVNVSGFTPTSNSCLSALNPDSPPCTVVGTFSPVATGPATLGVTYVYSNGGTKSVPLTTNTNVHSGSGPCHHIEATISLPLPTNSYIYADNVVKYVFTNACSTGAETLGNVTVQADGSANLVKGTDTCSGQTISATSSCSVFVSVVPTATNNDLSVTAAVPYFNNTLIASATTSESVNALVNQATKHTLMLVNQCDKQVWFGFAPGSSEPIPPANQSWSAFQLDKQLTGAAPATKVLQITQYTGGSIFGRTGCQTNSSLPNYGVCITANCTALNNSKGGCTQNPSFPTTIFEENFLDQTANDGVYDISMINGFNIPGEFRSLAPTTVSNPFDFTKACGRSAGAIIQPRGAGDPALGACSWSFTPPSTGTDCTAGTQTDTGSNYYYVPAGTSNVCTAGATPAGSCVGADEVCGMTWTPQPSSNPQYLGTPINRRCGTFQGYWTVADWIAYKPNGPGVNNWGSCDLYSHYSMSTTLDSVKPISQPTYGYSQLTPSLSPNLPPAALADLYACKPTSQTPVYVQPNGSIYSLNSGYDPGINACGCHDWNNTATTPANAQTAQDFQCKSINPVFTTYVYSRILWLKEACPTAYSYQFDDASSQFTCNVKGQRTSYQLTFCPGGKTGRPGT